MTKTASSPNFILSLDLQWSKTLETFMERSKVLKREDTSEEMECLQ